MQPNATELEILKIFWEHERLSARELHDRLDEANCWSISTTRTMLERMRAKNLLSREAVHGIAVYAAVDGKVQVLGSVIRRLARGVLEVRGELPVNAFSGSALLSAAELAEIAELVNRPDDPQ
ncbi:MULTISPECIES: BlaI/MecI/CopY family transcriptional regulator [unclassified Sphingomonas]|jgi:predicted transcriptional regulator|uniref:BlaI/MecI/CopY family transcriptional regulator n=1 Tax=unclassified Sphingomonas TaxID=196159 RepID=UPI00226ACA65|nr:MULTISPECIES: BlaI/MecI/CopY family transcriptional regulator [unclassified Sphingomonas]